MSDLSLASEALLFILFNYSVLEGFSFFIIIVSIIILKFVSGYNLYDVPFPRCGAYRRDNY